MVHDDDTGDTACDHYRRWADDLALMRALELKTIPVQHLVESRNADGARSSRSRRTGFYERLVDGLLESNIQPLVTLYHWDLPADLDDRGGWLNPDSASWFADYTIAMARVLDDRVPLWCTVNEPWVVADGGYLHGVLAGHRSWFEAPRVTHNLLRAHVSAVAAYRSVGRHPIGLVVNLAPQYPASRGGRDRAATARAGLAYMNRQYLDPLLLGRYPDGLPRDIRPRMAGPLASRFAHGGPPAARLPGRQLLHAFGRAAARAVRRSPDPCSRGLKQRRQRHTGVRLGGLSRRGLTRCAVLGARPVWRHSRSTSRRTAPHSPTRTAAPIDGVNDPLRVAYLRDHLLATRAIRSAAGVDVRGYFAWSLLDNFEWNYGYSKRFGIVHVDYATQVRTVKASGAFYADVIRSGGAVLG